ncbi:hypothetical protein N0V82_006601 [Gnomoniopsis sp. IMI 355080]|nr:hypothetical protein N0V82_006601 [Gnomoniopsis sp. IMI 355080]
MQVVPHGAEKRRRGSSASDTLCGPEEQPKRICSPSPRPYISVQNAAASGQSRMLNGNVHRDNIHGNVTTINHFHGSAFHSENKASENIPFNMHLSDGLSQREKFELKERLRFSQLDSRLQNLRQAEWKTCAWIQERQDYKEWLTSRTLGANDGFFWIQGNPGTGKSIAMKYLYQSMKASGVRRSSIVVSFFFNARGNDFEKSILGMYRSLLYNLFDKEPSLLKALDHCQRSGYLNILENGWSLQMVKEVFKEAVLFLDHVRKRTYCFVDALDECPVSEIREMINHFEGLVASTQSRTFRVCFSSRHYPQIILRTRLTLTLEKERNHDEDIKTYIDSFLRVNKDVDADLLDKIKTEILVKSSGIFLWVNLVVHQLNELSIQRDRMDIVWQHLQEIPRAAKEIPGPGEAIALYGLFKDIIEKDDNYIADFIRLIQIIFRAEQPLRPEELYVVLHERYGTPFQLLPVSGQTIATDVRRISKGLAEVTRSEKPTVQFIHETVREFLREVACNNFTLPWRNISHFLKSVKPEVSIAT